MNEPKKGIYRKCTIVPLLMARAFIYFKVLFTRHLLETGIINIDWGKTEKTLTKLSSERSSTVLLLLGANPNILSVYIVGANPTPLLSNNKSSSSNSSKLHLRLYSSVGQEGFFSCPM